MGTATITSPARANGLKPRRARTPKALQARKPTLNDAIDQWETTTRAIEGLKATRDAAAAVLLEHAERTGRRTFKDRIAVARSGGSLVLDQPAVREFLGDRLPEFQTRTKMGFSLKLLK
jgi:hypothetical protein